MGQVINVETEQVGDAVVFTADRSITGQAGAAFAPTDVGGGEADGSNGGEASADDGDFARALATRLFAEDEDLDHVWVASNTVVARRPTGWRPSDIQAAAEVLSNFFVYYRGAS